MEVVPDNHRCRWSPTEFRQLLKEVKKGLKIEKIAENHKRTIGAIKYKLIRYAIDLAEEDQSLSMNELCDITNLNKDDLIYGFEKLKFDYEYLINDNNYESEESEENENNEVENNKVENNKVENNSYFSRRFIIDITIAILIPTTINLGIHYYFLKKY